MKNINCLDFIIKRAILSGIYQSHRFNVGNKRTAFQVLDIVLNLNVVQISWNVEEEGLKLFRSRNQV